MSIGCPTVRLVGECSRLQRGHPAPRWLRTLKPFLQRDTAMAAIPTLKLSLIAVVVAIAAVLILAATKPDTFRVQRTASIKAPPEKIFPLIDNLHSNARWSPYYRKDPAMRGAYSGPDSGAGAQFDFDGNREVGSGRVTITDSARPGRVTMRLQMFKPMAVDNVVEFTLASRGETTDVTWAMQGKLPYLAKILHIFWDMDSMVGRDFEAGLANLKAIVET